MAAADRDDLLRIDSTGTMHPVGRVASQQLRGRVGEWRLLPSPKDLMLVRSTTSSDAVLKLAGEIRAPGALSDIVALAAQLGWRGELVVYAEAGIRAFCFDAGTIVGATTTVASERLGETLWRFGVITRDQLEMLLRGATETGKRLGELAIEYGFASSERIYEMMAHQVEEVFFGAVHVNDGAFYFFDRFDEQSIVRRQHLNAGGLLLEAARRMDEMRFFREKVPSDAFVPVRLFGKHPSAELSAFYALCDGKSSIADIGRITGCLEFEVTRAVFQLITNGCVAVVAPHPRGAQAIVETFNPALKLIHDRCDAASSGLELREGLRSFATGGGVYDPLFMGAGPLPNGTLRADRLARNIAAFGGDDADSWLISLLNDYVGFALFQAESMLSRQGHGALVGEVTAMLNILHAVKESPSQAAF